METTQQLYPCKLVQRVVVVTRIHAERQTSVGGRVRRELVFEQCSEAVTCPKAGQCPL